MMNTIIDEYANSIQCNINKYWIQRQSVFDSISRPTRKDSGHSNRGPLADQEILWTAIFCAKTSKVVQQC